jgi:predicted metallo-beta-lactamase superfamily hydrolase
VKVKMLAAESLGVRSLATWVIGAPGGDLLIDPGAALGPRRRGYAPHAREETALAAAGGRLLAAAERVQRIVITHFHHDHFVPFANREWVVSGPAAAGHLYRGKRIFVRDLEGPMNRQQRGRADQLARDLNALGVAVEPADARTHGDLEFSPAMRHGDKESPRGWVVMVAIRHGSDTIVHMSDTQLLNPAAIDWALKRDPGAVITSGPPLYLPQLTAARRQKAVSNLVRLAGCVPSVIVDHHLLRGGDIEAFLRPAREEALAHGHRLQSAAASLGLRDQLLESRRVQLHTAQQDSMSGDRLPRDGR